MPITSTDEARDAANLIAEMDAILARIRVAQESPLLCAETQKRIRYAGDDFEGEITDARAEINANIEKWADIENYNPELPARDLAAYHAGVL